MDNSLEIRFVLLTILVGLLGQGPCQPLSLVRSLALNARLLNVNGSVLMCDDTLKIILSLL